MNLIKIDKWINQKLEGINYKIKLLIILVAYLIGYTIKVMLR